MWARDSIVAVGADRSDEPVRTYQSFTGNLERLVDWLEEVRITR
jgi:transposase